MKKPVLVDFKIYNADKRTQFNQLPPGERARLENIAYQAKRFLQDNDCRIHGDRYQSLLISVVDGEVEIQASVCCSEYAKNLKSSDWEKFTGSFSVITPRIGGDFFSL